MTTLERIVPTLPALLAAFLLALLPACAISTPQRSGPIENPHIVERVAPRDADLPPGIQRGATGYDPALDGKNKADGDDYTYVFAILGVVLVGLLVLIAYGLYSLAEFVSEAIDD